MQLFTILRSLLLFVPFALALVSRAPCILRRKMNLGSTRPMDKPKWAGKDDLLSKVVNALISFKPLFSVMKLGARSTLIQTAEKNGIPWSERSSELRNIQSLLDKHFNALRSPEVVYPSYYTQEFHAYDEGNLNWNAAHECESATLSMALRVWPEETLSATEAQNRLRFSFLDIVNNYIENTNGVTFKNPKKILDVGASVGISTFYLARAYPKAEQIIGLDLSPHFLSVALHRQQDVETKKLWEADGIERISWRHAQMENSGLNSEDFDLTCASFVFHELPQEESKEILREMYRVTKRGGVVAITDNNPKSPVIQKLPPVLFTLMKSTEPWSDEYYVFELEQALEDVGFTLVKTESSDPRHRTIVALKR